MNLYDRLKEALATEPPTKATKLLPEPSSEYKDWLAANFNEVEIKPLIEHPAISDHVQLRRFMDLPKLLDLIAKRRIVLPPIADLQKADPSECSVAPDYSGLSRKELECRIAELREFAPVELTGMPTPMELLRGPFPYPTYLSHIERLSDDELRQAMWFVQYKRLSEHLFCSCWYGSEMESDAMWRLYCQQVGVVITTTVADLKDTCRCRVAKLFEKDFKLTLAPVDYNDSAVCNSEPWLVKRTAFGHEHELRLYVDYPFSPYPGFTLSVNPLSLIKQITVTPYANRWQMEAIQAASKSILGESETNARFMRSAHMDPRTPKWPRNIVLDELNRSLQQSHG